MLRHFLITIIPGRNTQEE